MNIDSTSTATTTKTTETSSKSSSSTSSTKDDSTSFKDELETVKAQDTKDSETKATEAKNAETANAESVKKTADEETKNAETLDKTKVTDSLNELNSKIAALSELKGGFNSKIQGVDSKSKDSKSDKGDYCQTMKMDNNDITFFVNLVDNKTMSAQNNQGIDPNAGNTFTDVKTEATQSTVQVSQTLLDALNDSAKTGKSFRVDFDNDIAVVMKVDKNGTLSANFIPGDAAVENYLKNNISSLRQSFDDQGLQYNELSYSKQQGREKEQEQSKNKENENE